MYRVLKTFFWHDKAGQTRIFNKIVADKLKKQQPFVKSILTASKRVILLKNYINNEFYPLCDDETHQKDMNIMILHSFSLIQDDYFYIKK